MGLLFVGEYPPLSGCTSHLATIWLSVREIGPDAPAPIASLAMDGNAVWVSSGPNVIKYLRGKEVRSCLQLCCALY